MDKFLNDFKNRVNKAREPDFNPSDWESFKAHKNAARPLNKPNTNSYWSKLRSAITIAASLLLISLYAYSIYQAQITKSNESQRVTEIAVKGRDTYLTKEKSNENEIKESEPSGGTEAFQTGKTDTNFEVTDQELMAIQKISKEEKSSDISTIIAEKENDQELVSESKFVSEAPKSKPGSQVHLYNDQKDKQEIHHDKIIELSTIDDLNDNAKKSDESFIKVADQSLSFISLKPALIQYNSEMLTIPHDIDLPSKNLQTPGFKRFHITGAAVFTKAFKDRIGASDIYGSRFAGSYYLTERLRFGINFSNSRYSRTMQSKDKAKYPALDDIKPRNVDEQIEELTVNASIIKTGLDLNYDFLSFGSLKNSFGLGFQTDISNHFSVRMRVRDRQGQQMFQNQKHKIIRLNRYYLSPSYNVEFALWKNISVFGRIQYDISVSEYRERYLNIDIGTSLRI